MKPENQIISDGKTVWVNDHNGHCTGRFSKFGIDVHKSFELAGMGSSECLHCTHEKPDFSGWMDFVKAMEKHHGVLISDQYKPEFISHEA